MEAIAELEEILGGSGTLRRKLQSEMDLVDLSQAGVPKGALLSLIRYLGWSVADMVSLLPITERTVQRYGVRQRFKPAVSEQILDIAQVVARGVEVFGDRQRFLAWMGYPSAALGDKKPVDLLSSRFGADLVMKELGRIEHGIPS